MARQSVVLDDVLTQKVKEILGVSSNTEAIKRAFEEVIRQHRLRQAMKDVRSFDLELDQKELDRQRKASVR